MLKINKKPKDLNELEKLLLEFSDKPWNWNGLSCNPNITMNFVKANPDKPWDWNELSRNPNITMDFVKANPDKPWDWDGLSWNRYGWNDLKIKREKAARLIQRNCLRWIFQPLTKDGKLGIQVRLGMKIFYGLSEAPLFPLEKF